MKWYQGRSKNSRRPIKFFHARAAVQPPDYFLGGLVLVILLFGLAMLSSASSVASFRQFNDTYFLWRHQLFLGVIPGLILFYFLSRFNYQHYRHYTTGFFILILVLLSLVFIPGLSLSHNSARSWIQIAGFSFQPSELAKLLLILGLAGWFSHRGRTLNADFWNGLIPFTLILGLVSLPILFQPDLGTLMVIIVIAFTVYFVAGAKWQHLLSLGLVGLGIFGLAIAFVPYRAARLLTFLHPEIDPQGIGYQINQAFLAIGSGGWLGLGFGQSQQKFAYLPEVFGDSIFAIIAEELGFIFSAFLIIVFLLLLWRGFKLAQQLDDDYGRYLTVGLIAWFGGQAFLNIGAIVGLLPLTGIPLPFVSYGGTALVSALAGAGILLNISRQV